MTWAHAVKTEELSGLGLKANEDWEEKGEGLKAEAERCLELTRSGVSFDFTLMIHFVKLVLKCQTYVWQSFITVIFSFSLQLRQRKIAQADIHATHQAAEYC